MPSGLKSLLLVTLLFPGFLHSQQAATTPDDTLFQSAVSQLQQGKYPEAEESFRKLSQVEPTSSRGILGIADVWMAQKKGDDALRLLQNASAVSPTRAELHFGVANIALRTAKYDLAIAEFQVILDRVDRNSKGAAEIYLRMGEAYRLKGDLQFAITLLEQAQALQPTNLAIMHTLAFTLEASGQRQPAAEQYRKILELEPQNRLALNNLAFILADTDTDPALALAYALRARQLAPNEPTIIDTLGWVYLKLKRAGDAIPMFREALQKNSGHATYRYHLAAALEMSGDHEGARREAEKALKSAPSKEDERMIKELLRIGQ